MFNYFKPHPKPNKTNKKRPKPIPKRSSKCKAIPTHAKKHLMLVKSLPCIACGSRINVEAHHITEGGKRIRKREGLDHYYTIPLCHEHHEGSILSIGNTKKKFIETYGTERSLLEKLWKLIKFDESRLL